MPTLLDTRNALVEDAKEIVAAAKRAGRPPTSTELAKANGLLEEIREADQRIDAAKAGDELLAKLSGLNGGSTGDGSPNGAMRLGLTGTSAKTLAGQIAAKMLPSSGFEGITVNGSQPYRKTLLPVGETAVAVPIIAGPVPQGRALPGLIDALPLVRVAGPEFDFVRQNRRTNLAAPVAVGGLKPTSIYELARVHEKLSVIAHLSEPTDKFLLEDSTALTSFVSDELIFGLRLAAESQIVSGDGVDPNLTGLLSTSGIQAVPAIADDLLGTLRTSIGALETLGYTASLIAMNPMDWQRVELSQDNDGRYVLVAGPVDRSARLIWGVPVTLSLGVPVGTAITLDSSAVAVVNDGSGIRVEWNPWTGFSNNTVVARCETRLGLSVYQPAAVAKVTLPAAPPVIP